PSPPRGGGGGSPPGRDRCALPAARRPLAKPRLPVHGLRQLHQHRGALLPGRRSRRGVAHDPAAREGPRVPGGPRPRIRGRCLLHPHQRRWPPELPPGGHSGGRPAPRALARADVMREDGEVFAQNYGVQEREDGLIRLRITDARTGGHHHVEFPEPTYDLDADANAEFETGAYPLRHHALITPASVFDYEIAGRQLLLLKQAPVLGGYDPAQYRSERIHAVASDGTRIPISL